MVKFVADNCTWKELHGRGRIVGDILFIIMIILSRNPTQNFLASFSNISYMMSDNRQGTNGSYLLEIVHDRGGGFVTGGIATIDP